MTRRRILAATALALLLGVGCARHRHSPAEAAGAAANERLPDGFARVLRDYEAAWTAKDAKELAALFADDGFVLPNGALPVRGREAIEKHYAGAGGPLALRALDWSACGSVGYMIGGYATAPGHDDVGKFTLTLRQGPDGRWLIVSDMDSPNARRP